MADMRILADLGLDPADVEEAAAASPGLSTPRVQVALDDGRTMTVQVRNPDYLRWDRTAAKHGWPPMGKAPFLWLTFVAWAALRREGLIPEDWSWEDFSERRCLSVRTARDDEATTAHPTPPGPGPG